MAAELNDLVGRFRSSLVIGMDMPLSLANAGSRRADPEAQEALGPRGRSVFPAPPAFILDEGRERASHAAANAESKRRYGVGISAQSHAPSARIRETNALRAAGERVLRSTRSCRSGR